MLEHMEDCVGKYSSQAEDIDLHVLQGLRASSAGKICAAQMLLHWQNKHEARVSSACFDMCTDLTQPWPISESELGTSAPAATEDTDLDEEVLPL